MRGGAVTKSRPADSRNPRASRGGELPCRDQLKQGRVARQATGLFGYSRGGSRLRYPRGAQERVKENPGPRSPSTNRNVSAAREGGGRSVYQEVPLTLTRGPSVVRRPRCPRRRSGSTSPARNGIGRQIAPIASTRPPSESVSRYPRWAHPRVPSSCGVIVSVLARDRIGLS